MFNAGFDFGMRDEIPMRKRIAFTERCAATVQTERARREILGMADIQRKFCEPKSQP